MTLGFSTKWPDKMGEMAGQPNYFIEKLHKSLLGTSISVNPMYGHYVEEHRKRFGKLWDGFDDDRFSIVDTNSKLHTIREDPHYRWRPGMKIHPVINSRTKNRFQFAPTLVCTAVQEIEIKDACHVSASGPNVSYVVSVPIKTPDWEETFHLAYSVKVDGKVLSIDAVRDLAQNDGFPSAEAFFMWFNKDFNGKLIHWSDLKY